MQQMVLATLALVPLMVVRPVGFIRKADFQVPVL
jgi:hypothetical protein